VWLEHLLSGDLALRGLLSCTFIQTYEVTDQKDAVAPSIERTGLPEEKVGS